jgi:hypothetical protein
MKKRTLFALVLVLVLLVLVAPILDPQPAEAACPAPGGGYPGALNMLHDATMLSIPMTRDNPQGNAGMSTAVANSSCHP